MSGIVDPLAHLLARTTAAVDDPDGCWTWSGYVDRDGYARWGSTTAERFGLSQMAYRAIYELMVEPVPAGQQLDHLCRNRGCVNPAHLEPVTPRENQLRGVGFVAENAAKSRCPSGHPYDEANTYVYESHGHTRRCCRACNRAAQQRRKAS